MDLILTDSRRCDAMAIESFTLDMAFGCEENDLELELPLGVRLSAGCLAYVDGTDYGGMVDTLSVRHVRHGSKLAYSGRTWHGILDSKVLEPDAGADYLEVSGEANTVLSRLIARMDLGDLFFATESDSGIWIDYRFERYPTGWEGVLGMLASAGAKPVMRFRRGKVELSAALRSDYGGSVDSDLLDFTLVRQFHPYNHIIGLGGGELADRLVTHWYANERGLVSKDQTFFGSEERTYRYEYTGADAEKLEEESRKELESFQGEGSIEVSPRDSSVSFDVGDTVRGRDHDAGIYVSGTVMKKLVRVSRGVVSESYEIEGSAECIS